MIKDAFCGCLQNDEVSDEGKSSVKEKKPEKKKSEKFDTKKLGSYIQLMKEKKSKTNKDIEIIFDLLQN